MRKTVFTIHKMDCPAEEQLVRLALSQNSEIENLQIDLPNRILVVYHHLSSQQISQQLEPLKFSHSQISDEDVDQSEDPFNDKGSERRLLWIAFAINFGLFISELFYGVLSDSMGLVADSLDMLADSIVYAISLLAVGAARGKKLAIARMSGYFQISLGLVGFSEIIRRVFLETEVPDFKVMMWISLVALIGNSVTLRVLSRSRSDGAHMKASMIFTSNDIKINIGVIVSGILVFLFESKIPDLVVGTIIFGIVSKGAFDIIKMTVKK